MSLDEDPKGQLKSKGEKRRKRKKKKKIEKSKTKEVGATLVKTRKGAKVVSTRRNNRWFDSFGFLLIFVIFLPILNSRTKIFRDLNMTSVGQS